MNQDPVDDVRWRTASFARPPDTSPAELAELAEHLHRCRQRRGRLFAARTLADVFNSFLAPRFVSTLLIVSVLAIAACMTF